MFSKALFKQSMKAHWVKWVFVTVPTCVMLAIVIIVLGNLGINDIRDSLKEIFVQADQESTLKEEAVDGYELYTTTTDFYGVLSPNASLIGMLNSMLYQPAINEANPTTDEERNAVRQSVAEQALGFITGGTLPSFRIPEGLDEDYLKQFFVYLFAAYDTMTNNGADTSNVDNDQLLINAYTNLVADMAYAQSIAEEGATEDYAQTRADGAREIANAAITEYKGQQTAGTLEDADFESLANEYINNYIYQETYDLIYQQNIDSGMSASDAETSASEYAVMTKVIANTAITTYQFWINERVNEATDAGTDYDLAAIKTEARTNACQSISDQMPEAVAEALSELGNMDIYGLIIGSIFYRIAGLLLPMVFVIMTANSLLAGQVDSGSMAYVLSTPTKRRTVTITQMVYLIVALLAMYILLTVTSVISVFIVGGNNFAINYAEILLFNAGAFLTMFAIAGFCFMCSSLFNRAKYSLGVGGGLTIFSLVCTILGLFGSSVVPSAMRISAMNVFNYFSMITLFDTVSIMSGTLDYLWKFAILLGIGIVTFIIGVFRFEKKDLPL